MKRINAVKALSALSLVLLAPLSHADYVKYEFTAHGTSVSYGANVASDFSSSSAAAYLTSGTGISGYIYYDLSTPFTYAAVPGGEPDYKTYYSTAKIGLGFSSGNGYSFLANYTGPEVYDQNSVDVQDYQVGAAYQLDHVHVAGQNITPTVFQYAEFNLDGNYHALSSTALPGTLSLSDFNGTLYLRWEDDSGKQFVFNAVVDTLTPVAAVPEPASYVLMLGGLALVGAVVRRRQRDAA